MSVIDPRERAPWRSDRMGKETLHRSDRLMVGLNAFEPGQVHSVHAHEGADKLYVALEGSGTVELAGERRALVAGQVIVAPAGVPHGVENPGPGRLLLLVAMAPAP